MTTAQHFSAVDIEAQLRDPNSYASKLYRAVVAEYASALAADKLLFQLFLESLVREELRSQQEGREQAEEISLLGAVAQRPVLVPVPGATDSKAQEKQMLQAQLVQELRNLLTVDQSTMTLPQLTQHHQAIMSNYHSQLALSIGPTVTLPSGTTLTVPATTTTPPAPAVTVLARNEGLRKEVLAREDGPKDFAVHHAQLSTSALTPFNLAREIKEASGIEHLSARDTIALMEIINRNMDIFFKPQHPNGGRVLFVKLTSTLSENNYRSIQKQFPAEIVSVIKTVSSQMEVDALPSALSGNTFSSIPRGPSLANPPAHFAHSDKKRPAADLDAGITIVPSSKR